MWGARRVSATEPGPSVRSPGISALDAYLSRSYRNEVSRLRSRVRRSPPRSCRKINSTHDSVVGSRTFATVPKRPKHQIGGKSALQPFVLAGRRAAAVVEVKVVAGAWVKREGRATHGRVRERASMASVPAKARNTDRVRERGLSARGCEGHGGRRYLLHARPHHRAF